MRNRLATYQELQESGVIWLGDVPRHWIVAKTGWYFKVAMGQTILKEDLIDDGEWPVFSATDGDHYFGYVDNPKVRLNIGDIVIPARGNSIGSVKLVKEPATTTQTTIYCKRESPKLVPEFVYYYLNGCKNNLFYFTQTAIPQITVEEVSSNPILIPPVDEQKQIAAFLDYETLRIDALIEKQQQLIALLGEKRQAVISHAVTKGLNPDAPMRDSGVEWLGEVPEHWKVLSTCRVCDLTTGERDTQDAVPDGKYPFFVRSNNVERIDSYSFDGEGVLTSGDGAGVGKIFHHFNGRFEYHQRVYLFHNFQGITGRFFFYFLREHLAIVALAGNAKSTVDSLRRPMLRMFPLCLPPIEEQEAITQYLDEKIEKIDKLISVQDDFRDLLQERRAALISAAVTGKIDVRGWKRPAADSGLETELEVA